MVYGIEKFKEYFGDYTGQYVFIGGTACDILLDEIGASFRVTKDLDMVLLIEALDGPFGAVFWKFIEDGGYEHKQKSTGGEQFYRFSKPKETGFPAMIELFSRRPEKMSLPFDAMLTPIHISDSLASLSAVLLKDAYYKLLLAGKSVVDGYSVLAIEYILLFKIKAWMDLSKRKENGEQVDSKDINKHKNDIFRLLANISPSSKVEIDNEINNDVNRFIENISNDKVDLKNLGILTASFEEMLDRIRKLYVRTTA
jgi:hypothetical protein